VFEAANGQDDTNEAGLPELSMEGADGIFPRSGLWDWDLAKNKNNKSLSAFEINNKMKMTPTLAADRVMEK
jgi:hypothetical protein